MYFRYERLSKVWLDHSMKIPLSEHSSRDNTFSFPKHLLNLHGSTLIIFLHHSESKGFAKISPDLSLKS